MGAIIDNAVDKKKHSMRISINVIGFTTQCVVCNKNRSAKNIISRYLHLLKVSGIAPNFIKKYYKNYSLLYVPRKLFYFIFSENIFYLVCKNHIIIH